MCPSLLLWVVLLFGLPNAVETDEISKLRKNGQNEVIEMTVGKR